MTALTQLLLAGWLLAVAALGAAWLVMTLSYLDEHRRESRALSGAEASLHELRWAGQEKRDWYRALWKPNENEKLETKRWRLARILQAAYGVAFGGFPLVVASMRLTAPDAPPALYILLPAAAGSVMAVYWTTESVRSLATGTTRWSWQAICWFGAIVGVAFGAGSALVLWR